MMLTLCQEFHFGYYTSGISFWSLYTRHFILVIIHRAYHFGHYTSGISFWLLYINLFLREAKSQNMPIYYIWDNSIVKRSLTTLYCNDWGLNIEPLEYF